MPRPSRDGGGAQHVLCRAAICTRVELACEPFDNIEYHGLFAAVPQFFVQDAGKDDNGRIVVVRE